jgi:hypothetical protein
MAEYRSRTSLTLTAALTATAHRSMTPGEHRPASAAGGDGRSPQPAISVREWLNEARTIRRKNRVDRRRSCVSPPPRRVASYRRCEAPAPTMRSDPHRRCEAPRTSEAWPHRRCEAPTSLQTAEHHLAVEALVVDRARAASQLSRYSGRTFTLPAIGYLTAIEAGQARSGAPIARLDLLTHVR